MYSTIISRQKRFFAGLHFHSRCLSTICVSKKVGLQRDQDPYSSPKSYLQEIEWHLKTRNFASTKGYYSPALVRLSNRYQYPCFPSQNPITLMNRQEFVDRGVAISPHLDYELINLCELESFRCINCYRQCTRQNCWARSIHLSFGLKVLNYCSYY